MSRYSIGVCLSWPDVSGSCHPTGVDHIVRFQCLNGPNPTVREHQRRRLLKSPGVHQATRRNAGGPAVDQPRRFFPLPSSGQARPECRDSTSETSLISCPHLALFLGDSRGRVVWGLVSIGLSPVWVDRPAAMMKSVLSRFFLKERCGDKEVHRNIRELCL